MKHKLIAAFLLFAPFLVFQSRSQSTLEGKYEVQNISFTTAGIVMADPYPALFYGNWKQNVPVVFTRDSVTYLISGTNQRAAYTASPNQIVFQFAGGKAQKYGDKEISGTAHTTSTYELESIRGGFRLVLDKGENISIMELVKK